MKRILHLMVVVPVALGIVRGQRSVRHISHTSLSDMQSGLTRLACRPWQPEGTGGEGCPDPGPVGVAVTTGRRRRLRRGSRWVTGAPPRCCGGGCWSRCTGLTYKQRSFSKQQNKAVSQQRDVVSLFLDQRGLKNKIFSASAVCDFQYHTVAL